MNLSWEPLEHESLLVVSESWAPGWRARLADGTPAETVRVGGATLGVVIPAEHDKATLYYRPDGWIRGQQLFGGGCIVLLVGLVIARRRATTDLPSRLHTV